MNKENLQKMADYIRTVPQEMFDIEIYRRGNETKPKCDSVGCVVGHCTILDSEPLPVNVWGEIWFDQWSENFTGLLIISDAWHWCFSSDWLEVDNTPEGAAKRIEWLINHGLPEDWRKQMHGLQPLCYK